MNIFDEIVTEALKNQPRLAPLKIVVEKELLHHDILRVMNENQLLNDLTFIGGTCLRSCYGGVRLSEDLDFTGGSAFSRETLASLGAILREDLNQKYGLAVSVSEPVKDTTNVDTWKVKVETRPGQPHLPAQRINIDICAVPSYDIKPAFLLNPYGVDMGTEGLVIQSQSREEIFADKLVAFALRPNRIKNRDLWDISWLYQQGVQPAFHWVAKKVEDRHKDPREFLKLFSRRCKEMTENKALEVEYKKEMRRFLPVEIYERTLESGNHWGALLVLMAQLEKQLIAVIGG